VVVEDFEIAVEERGGVMRLAPLIDRNC
jgi:hypothetical protein